MKTPEGWARVFQGSRLEADLVMSVLEAAGLRTATLGGVGEITAAEPYDSQVYVPAGQEREALSILAARRDA